ncbi:oxidoreductase [Actinorhabdospora filicis]|uniref:Oxidoreductase n=1 Tax=Actinorhabdospora filicis TaxID=1785913 RepID=A0A9W6SRW1_9ACTN|nr:NADH:flavin oxidoreductase/NADH oxidase [Actinorhabdospora filicis]GLZ81256.1 oxidoreductase [Actinorhabdospora filicis]
MLFEPLKLRDLVIPNRVWMAPMCQYSCGPDGLPTDWHMTHYTSRAVGGAGLILTEATAVASEGRISPWDLGLWNDGQRDALRGLVERVQASGTAIGVQLSHAGRKASTGRPWEGGGRLDLGWRVVGPSPVAFAEGWPVPHELTAPEIAEIVAGFAAAARRAREAGFDVVEVHGAHGYLISAFLSPLANHRTDAYGRDRALLAVEVASAVRAEWPAGKPVFFRVSATDWVPGGFEASDAVALTRRLADVGVDLMDVSTGGNAPGARIPVGPGYQVEFAARVRAGTGLPVAAVGMITTPPQASRILASGAADAVLLGRELLRDPYWPRRARGGEGVPPQYARAY